MLNYMPLWSLKLTNHSIRTRAMVLVVAVEITAEVTLVITAKAISVAMVVAAAMWQGMNVATAASVGTGPVSVERKNVMRKFMPHKRKKKTSLLF
jgi:hypothetical protein